MTDSFCTTEIHRKIVDTIDTGTSFAVVLVLKAEGSTPLKTGAKALVEASGRIWGTIGGGAVEAEAQRRAVQACASGRPLVFDFHMEGASRSDDTPICGGAMRILVDPCAARHRETYVQVAEALAQGQRGVLLTTVRQDAQGEVTLTWQAEAELTTCQGLSDAGCLQTCLAKEVPCLFSDSEGMTETLIEPVIPRPRLLIAGGGHVGQALARQAVLVEFAVTIIDDRPEFTDSTLYPPGVATQCGDIPQQLADSPMNKDTYIVIVTRGHQCDAEALEACIRRPTAYVGMIGSKRKVGLIRQSLIESGLATDEEFERVYAPIGLDIGSVTAGEIATSIVAQLIAVRRQGALR
jgi:xanthine dehydrogenase accessory factor